MIQRFLRSTSRSPEIFFQLPRLTCYLLSHLPPSHRSTYPRQRCLFVHHLLSSQSPLLIYASLPRACVSLPPPRRIPCLRLLHAQLRLQHSVQVSLSGLQCL